MQKRQRGFTLIEIVMAVALIAVLATIALPTYQDSVRKAKRTAARGMLMDVVSRQEQYFINNKRYAGTLTDLGLADPYYVNASADAVAASADSRVYQISLAGTTNTSFDVMATALLQQVKDSCGNYTLGSDGSQAVSGSLAASICW